MEGDIENARSSVEILEESSSEKHLEFYRSMAVFVHNLVECLQEKVSAHNICSERYYMNKVRILLIVFRDF